MRSISFLFVIAFAAPSLADDPQGAAQEILARFDHEPNVRSVQRRAMTYAHAEPAKVASWRQRARLSSLLPENTVGLDDLLLTGWLDGREAPLRVVGPAGTAEFAVHRHEVD